MNRRQFISKGVGQLGAAFVSTAAAEYAQSTRPIVIDAHAHSGYLGVYGQREVKFEEALQAADEAGIDKLCVSSIEALTFEMREGNAAVYQLMKRYPGRVVGFASLPSPHFGKKGLGEIQRAVE